MTTTTAQETGRDEWRAFLRSLYHHHLAAVAAVALLAERTAPQPPAGERRLLDARPPR